MKEFANFDFDVWRKKYMRWMNHKKSRVMDFFRRIDKDQDGKITRQEFIDGILASSESLPASNELGKRPPRSDEVVLAQGPGCRRCSDISSSPE